MSQDAREPVNGEDASRYVDLGYDDGDEPDFFAQVNYFVLDHPALGRREKDAYICLVRGLGFGERRKRARVKREDLAKVMSISVDTLDKGIKGLEEAGIIEVRRSRDPKTGNFNVNAYIFKDTKHAQLRARMLVLQRELEDEKAKNTASPQVSTSPQNAARHEEGEPDSDPSQAAKCGLDSTSENTASPQVGSSPQNAAPPSRSLRPRRAANCGHKEERDNLRENKNKRGETQPPLLLAVGEPADRNARASSAPAAQGEDQFEPPPTEREVTSVIRALPGRYTQGLPERYRLGMRSIVRKALSQGYGVLALAHYAKLCASDGDYAADKHLPLLKRAIGLLHQDVRLGLACRVCGREQDDGDRPRCDTCNPGVLEPDGPDPETLAKIRAQLGVRPDELDQAEGA